MTVLKHFGPEPPSFALFASLDTSLHWRTLPGLHLQENQASIKNPERDQIELLLSKTKHFTAQDLTVFAMLAEKCDSDMQECCPFY